MTLGIGEVPPNITGTDVTMHVAGAGQWPELNQMMAATGMNVGSVTNAAQPASPDNSWTAVLNPENPGMG